MLNKDIRAVLSLIKQGADIEAKSSAVGWTPLHMAAGWNVPKAIAVLVRFGARINDRDEDGDTPLMTACSMCHIDCVQQLLAGGADPKLLSASVRRSVYKVLIHH